MAKFGRLVERKRRDSSSSRDRNRDGPRGRRDSGRDFNRGRRDRSNLEMTKVTCSSCGVKCEVPFKPTSNKPVYCSDCFSKKDNSSSNKPSNKGLEIINEKLDKIMKALKIE